jgi:hypothetical protein
MSETQTIKKVEWTRPKLVRFKAEYERQQELGKGFNDTFGFDGNEFVMGYAKYLIEFLEAALV